MTDNGFPATYVEDARVTIRPLRADDLPAIERVAQRDSSRVPSGRLLGADMDGRLVAAISTATGHVVADPFVHTAGVVEALRARVGDVDGRPARRRGRLVAFLRPGRARGTARAPSQPAAGAALARR